ncbi:hypothetical protein BGX38DRAFT_1333895 [Terfezia claveryi]|nr:hypothetical protein BGX38DRAFT_1333895 [Terfezia claveryi]
MTTPKAIRQAPNPIAEVPEVMKGLEIHEKKGKRKVMTVKGFFKENGGARSKTTGGLAWGGIYSGFR